MCGAATMDNEEKLNACSPRRKIQEARFRDRKAAEYLDASADAKDEVDHAADSKDSKAYACKGDEQSSIAEFSFSFIKRIISSAPKR